MYDNGIFFYFFIVIFLRPYLQCCFCENPLGCLQLMLRLYLSDHLWRCACVRVRVRVRVPRIIASTCFLGFLTSRSGNGILYYIIYMYILFIHNMLIIYANNIC
jgi:hypothetical protein